MLSIIDTSILKEEHYVIQKYSVYQPDRRPDTKALGVKCQTKKNVVLLEDMEPFSSKVHGLSKNHHGSIFVDGANTVVISKQHIMEQLREHLTSHIVVTKGRYGNRFMLQSTGIPQGSVLSSLLCNFYYGDIERRLLGKRFNQHASATPDISTNVHSVDLLARMVDDFLLVSTNLDDMEHFFATMYRGDRDLGVNINKDKTCSSISLKIADEDTIGNASTHVDIQGLNLCSHNFPWCGMLFDVTTGEVRIDFTRFVDGKGRDTLTVDTVNQKGEHLFANMKQFVKPRCLAILYDPTINGSKVRVINYYQLMAYAAVKTAEYLKYLRLHTPDTNSRDKGAIFINAPFLLHCVEHTISFATDLINARVNTKQNSATRTSEQQCVKTNLTRRPIFFLPRSLTIWLGWRAFHDVFRRQLSNDYQSFAATEIRPRMNDAGVMFTDFSQVTTTGKKNYLYDLSRIERIVQQALGDIDLSKLVSH